MKQILLPLILASIPGSSFAALVTFQSYSYSTPPGVINDGNPNGINGQDGWTQSEATIVDAGKQFPIFYTENVSGNRYGAIGGVYATPDSPPFSASRDFASAGTVGNTAFSFQASIQDGMDFPDRNTFGFSLSDGATSLLTVTLVPDQQTGPTQWAINYKVGTGATVATGLAFLPTGLYNLMVDFSNTGLEFSFQNAAGGTLFDGYTGTPTGYNAASTNALKATFTWAQGPGASFGDNRMLIDNIQTVAVPEPGSLMLLSLAGLGFLRRRR